MLHSKKMLVLGSVLLLASMNVATADVISTGALYGPNDDGEPVGLGGVGAWIASEPVVTWTVTWDGGDVVNYCYTLSTGGLGEVSHAILQVSDDLETADITNVMINDVAWTNYSIGTFDQGPSNPDMPDSIYGIKFEDTDETTIKICFDSTRWPMDGDIYAKDGKAGNDDKSTNQIWNTGLGDPQGAKLPVPDTTDVLSRGDVRIVKFQDTDGDGLPGAPGDEPRLEGWTFEISGPTGTVTVTTGPDGSVKLLELVAGTYSINELAPPAGFEGWSVSGSVWLDPDTNSPTTGGDPLTGVVVVTGGETVVFFGNVPEPAACILMTLGSIGVVIRKRRRRGSVV